MKTANKTVKECLGSEKNEEVVVIGLLCNPKDGVTKNGKPYADFDLYANGATIQIKVWDMGTKEFLDRKGIELGKPVIVNGTISVNPQNGVKQICVKDGEIPAAGPYSVPGESMDATIESLVNATPVAVDKMVNTISALVGHYFTDEKNTSRSILKNICDWGFDTLKSNCNSPYGPTVHKERSGLLAHVYNSLNMLHHLVGVPEFDKGVVLASILTYRLGSTFIYTADYTTGLIKETKPLAEYGTEGSFCSQFVISWSGCLNQALGDVFPELRNYMACINALNGVSEPVSIESQIALGVVTTELETFRIYEAVDGREPSEPAFVVKDGEAKTVYNFKE